MTATLVLCGASNASLVLVWAGCGLCVSGWCHRTPCRVVGWPLHAMNPCCHTPADHLRDNFGFFVVVSRHP
jgi:hypothetical protein